MKRFIIAILAIALGVSARSATVTYNPATGAILYPENFFEANSNDIVAAIGGAFPGSGSGNASTNVAQGWSAPQVFTAPTNEFTGTLVASNMTTGTLRAQSMILDEPIGVPALGTNLADAQAELQLTPDVNVQTFRLALLQIAIALTASGDMPYRNASGILTNVSSTAAGRTLLAALDAAAQRTALGVPSIAGDTFTGPLLVPYDAYDPAWTNNSHSNEVVTKKAFALKAELLGAGGSFFSAVDTNFTNSAGTLKFAANATVGSGALVRESSIPTGLPATNSVSVEIFTNNGTWTKPAGAKLVRVIAIGGGAGGGSGRRGTNAHAGGGGGGSGGGMVDQMFFPAELASPETVTVGTNGLGAPANTTDSSDGTSGSGGGASTFGTAASAPGGSGGGGGLGTGSNAGGGVLPAMWRGGQGGAGAGLSAAAAATAVDNRPGGGGGGGGGGSITTAGVTNSGGRGAHVLAGFQISGGDAGTAGSPVGTNGTSFGGASTTIIPRPGAGAGGGYTGANGGVGGWPGGGGGGGGGVKNGTASGAGGDGAPGVVVVFTYF